MKIYRERHGGADWSDLYRKNTQDLMSDLRMLGFVCSMCGEPTVTAENFRYEDFSEITRCFPCQKKNTLSPKQYVRA